MKLIIIEGEGKRETIGKYLKGLTGDYQVVATKGHVRDLPAKKLAVEVKNNFEPNYEIMPDKKAVIDVIKAKAARAEDVLLATDPDREGEAISWHLANILNIPADKKCRIVFNEISKKAVERALSEPRAIDAQLVDAQQARRVLDRLVGYKLSPVLSKKIRSKLSAGRVQSVTLRLVVERETEIRNFKPEEFWTLKAVLDKDGAVVNSLLVKHKGKKIKIASKDEMDEVLATVRKGAYRVVKLTKSVTKSRASAPYITSTMQQDALNKLGMSLKATSSAAQQLYEGVDMGSEGKVALVTYIRTDSFRVSPEAQAAAADYIKSKFGADYAPKSYNFFKSKKNVQDAHEAIRPISLERTPDSLKAVLSKTHYRLYKMIYERFLASQMSEAQYNSVSAEIDCEGYIFKASGKTLLFAGYTAAYESYAATAKSDNQGEGSDEDGEVADGLLPPMEEGDILKLIKLIDEQKFTKPPARYTEASLVKAMEERGIGRPATYVPTVLILFAREYAEREGKNIVPTELGFSVVDTLIKYFPDIMNIDFTANMEDELDEIENGGKVWQRVIGKFYEGLEDKISSAMSDSFSLKPADEQSDVLCDKCGANMVIRGGRYGKFLACPNFPKCRNTKPTEPEGGGTQSLASDRGGNGESNVAAEAAEDAPNCDKCGKVMTLKNSRFGKFWACSGYPDCRSTKPYIDEKNYAGRCPKCGKALIKRRSAKGTFFYGCSGYPDCKFLTNDPVIDEKCPDCGGYMVKKTSPDGKVTIRCGSKECGYKREETAPRGDGQTAEGKQ